MIGERIKELRIKNGETQETLAKAIGVTAQAVSKWENNITTPDITLLVPIADYFKVTTDYLLREPAGKPAKQPIDTASIIQYSYVMRWLEALSERPMAITVNITNITERRIKKLWYRAKLYDLDGVQVDELLGSVFDIFPNVTKHDMLLSNVSSSIAKIRIEVAKVKYAD